MKMAEAVRYCFDKDRVNGQEIVSDQVKGGESP
jgi:hypothetical protein